MVEVSGGLGIQNSEFRIQNSELKQSNHPLNPKIKQQRHCQKGADEAEVIAMTCVEGDDIVFIQSGFKRCAETVL